MRNSSVYRLALDSMMASLFLIFSYFSIPLGNNLTLSFASATIVLVSLLYSPTDALFVALIGETINQMIKYGPSPTTPLWLLPVMMRALIISLVAAFFRHKGTYLEKHVFFYYLTLIVAALFTTLCNTGIIVLDAYLMNYPSRYTLISTLFRFLSGMITSIVVASVMLPIVLLLGKLNIGRVKCKEIQTQKNENMAS